MKLRSCPDAPDIWLAAVTYVYPGGSFEGALFITGRGCFARLIAVAVAEAPDAVATRPVLNAVDNVRLPEPERLDLSNKACR